MARGGAEWQPRPRVCVSEAQAQTRHRPGSVGPRCSKQAPESWKHGGCSLASAENDNQKAGIPPWYDSVLSCGCGSGCGVAVARMRIRGAEDDDLVRVRVLHASRLRNRHQLRLAAVLAVGVREEHPLDT